jgi:hypothetical protein
VVDDLAAATAFSVELALKPQGEGTAEGDGWIAWWSRVRPGGDRDGGDPDGRRRDLPSNRTRLSAAIRIVDQRRHVWSEAERCLHGRGTLSLVRESVSSPKTGRVALRAGLLLSFAQNLHASS